MDDAAGFTQESHKYDNTNDWFNDGGTDEDDDTIVALMRMMRMMTP